MRRLVLGLVLATLAGGCGRAPASLAGGKPVRHWIEALHDPDRKTRKLAAFKLGNVGTADPSALPALVGALQDRDAAVRGEVILALVKFGPLAQEAVPALTEVRRHDRNSQVRAYAGRALEKIQTE
jgi:HEAT repeat protein